MTYAPDRAPVLHLPTTLDDALQLLTDRALAPLAGGTWVMRAPLRRERWAEGYVAVAGLPELRMQERLPDELRLGAGLTHAETADATSTGRDLHALHQAAAHSANPAVRQRATIGGNLCSTRFQTPDLTTALLCLDARIVVAHGHERREIPVEDHIATPKNGRLVTSVAIPRTAACTGHARLPLRHAGDYPVAIVSVALVPADDGTVLDARIAVGSVEPVPRRWREVERLLVGKPADPATAAAAAAACAGSVTGRDGVDAPGWYRERVLPTLFARAVATATTSGNLRGAA
jgi:carbon-monoxide dehydrogenase medium subunit